MYNDVWGCAEILPRIAASLKIENTISLKLERLLEKALNQFM